MTTSNPSRESLASAQRAVDGAHAELTKIASAIARAQSQRALFKDELEAAKVEAGQAQAALASAFVYGKKLPDVAAIETKKETLGHKFRRRMFIAWARR